MNILTTLIDPFGIWRIVLTLGLIGTISLVAPRYRLQYGWAATLLGSYTLAFAALILEAPVPMYGLEQRAYQATAGQSLAEILLLLLLVNSKPGLIHRLIPWLVGIEILMIFSLGHGMMMPVQGASFDTALIALCLPFLPKWWMKVPAVATILAEPLFLHHHGATALMILYAEIVAYAIHDRRWRNILIGVSLIAVAGVIYHPPSTMDRITPWIRYMRAWAEDWRVMIFGVGPGTFMWTSLKIDHFKEPMFLEMHNDWLQIFFEEGTIGGVLALGVFARAIWQSKRDSRLLSAVLAVGAFGLTYHPLRFFPSAVVIAFIFSQALRYTWTERSRIGEDKMEFSNINFCELKQ